MRRVLREHGIPPARQRSGTTTWRAFLRTQAAGLLSCDFFEAGCVNLTNVPVFFVMELRTRTVHVLGVTRYPAAEFAAQCARELLMQLGDRAGQFTALVRDRDAKYGTMFDGVLASAGVVVSSALRNARR